MLVCVCVYLCAYVCVCLSCVCVSHSTREPDAEAFMDVLLDDLALMQNNGGELYSFLSSTPHRDRERGGKQGRVKRRGGGVG